MQFSVSIRKLINCKKDNTAVNSALNDSNTSAEIPAMNSRETNENGVLKIRAQTQEEVDEQLKSFLAHLMSQLGDVNLRKENWIASKLLSKARYQH